MIHTIKCNIQSVPGSDMEAEEQTIQHPYRVPFTYRFEVVNEHGPFDISEATSLVMAIGESTQDLSRYKLTLLTFPRPDSVEGVVSGDVTLPTSMEVGRYVYTVRLTNLGSTYLLIPPSTFRILPA